MAHHLAQINISPLLAPLDDPKIAEFVAKLEPINASPATASGGSQPATSPSSPKVVSGWNTIRNMAQSHTRSGFPSTSPSPLMKVSARSLTERPLHPVTKRAANAKIGP